MIEIGKKQTLIIVKEVKFGVYLGESRNAEEKERVLLPGSQVPEGKKTGDSLEVFIYLDSSDRPIATVKEPLITLGGLAVLKVKQVTRIGAFLDWGLEKDLLLPFHEQTKKVREGEDCLVALYLDKSHRLCATMKVYHYLSNRAPYGIGDEVTGRIYEISDNFGVFIAIDDKYNGLIPKREAQAEYTIGSVIPCRITEVKEDGKLSVSARKKAYLQMDDDAAHVLQVLKKYDNVLPFDDKASPETIQRVMGLSKNAFKRAVGHLLKEGSVEISQGHIRGKK
ncbi:MAG: S1 RNA-binding domain-containing protein [Blautia sp.]|nr:S1 RNA-binding domain-containing protein [Blautia sp.]